MEQEDKKVCEDPTLSELFMFRITSLFDKRYVLKEGDWVYIKLLVFGCAGLMLSTVVIAALSFVVHKSTLP